MLDKFSRSWSLTKQSWAVLAQDKRLIAFPAISGILTLLVCASLLAPLAIWKSEWTTETRDGVEQHTFQLFGGLGLVALFIAYFVANFFTVYFNVALMHCVFQRFDGQEAGPMDGIRFANTRIGRIVAWALINATVGTVIQALKEKADFLGRLVLGGAGVAWHIATFFVVPVMVVEDVGPVEAVKRSVAVLRKTWGESLISQGGVSFALFLLALGAGVLIVGAGIAIGVMGHTFVAPIVAFALWIAFWLVLVAVGSAMKTVLVAACYRFAATGECPGMFERQVVEGAFSTK